VNVKKERRDGCFERYENWKKMKNAMERKVTSDGRGVKCKEV